jgi:hypothetical protein
MPTRPRPRRVLAPNPVHPSRHRPRGFDCAQYAELRQTASTTSPKRGSITVGARRRSRRGRTSSAAAQQPSAVTDTADVQSELLVVTTRAPGPSLLNHRRRHSLLGPPTRQPPVTNLTAGYNYSVAASGHRRGCGLEFDRGLRVDAHHACRLRSRAPCREVHGPQDGTSLQQPVPETCSCWLTGGWWTASVAGSPQRRQQGLLASSSSRARRYAAWL